METSSASRNRAPHKTTRMPQRRGFQRYSAAGAIVDVVMISTICMCKQQLQGNLLHLHLVPPRRYTAPMTPRQASADLGGACPGGASLAEAGPGLAEVGSGGVGTGNAGGLPPLVSAWRALAPPPAAGSTALPRQLGERHRPRPR